MEIFKINYKLLFIFIIVIIIVLLWARYISTSGIIVKEYKVPNQKLPQHFHGLKIVHFSDVHYGRTIKKEELKKIVKKINFLNPDLVVFTGDLIDRTTDLTPAIKKTIVKELKKIKATYGKYAISGNHDLVFKEYNNILTSSDFINLDNNYDLIYNKEQELIFIGGLETQIKGKPNINKVMQVFQEPEQQELTKDTYKILLMHTTDIFDQVKQHNFALALGGHSHNGQVRLPFIGSLITPHGSKKYSEPYYKIKNTDFFISSGLGTSTLNFRFFNKPAINFYRLTTK